MFKLFSNLDQLVPVCLDFPRLSQCLSIKCFVKQRTDTFQHPKNPLLFCCQSMIQLIDMELQNNFRKISNALNIISLQGTDRMRKNNIMCESLSFRSNRPAVLFFFFFFTFSLVQTLPFSYFAIRSNRKCI